MDHCIIRPWAQNDCDLRWSKENKSDLQFPNNIEGDKNPNSEGYQERLAEAERQTI